MKKIKILVLIALCSTIAYSQSNRTTAMVKLLIENYPNRSDSIYGIMLSNLSGLRQRVSDAMLEFRVKCNPEINPSTVYDTIRQRFQPPKRIFSLQSPYEVIFELQPFEYISNDRKVKPPNFFVLNKKGTKILTGFREDTLSLTQYDKYYPFDEKLLVYCNPEEGSGADVKILSGACDLSFFDIRPYKKTLLNMTEPHYAAFFRLHRFGLKELEQIRVFYPPDDSFPLDYLRDSMSWFRIDSFALAKGNSAVVKVPYPDKFSDKYNYFDGIEVIFYEWPLPSENKGNGFWEVKYTFHNKPKSYEDTLPKYRKLAQEEILKMGRWYFETFLEPVIRYEAPPEDKK